MTRSQPRRGAVTSGVSVVVPTYRRTESLAACLDGLRAQTRPPAEVVVVVHRSDDPSARRVESLMVAWPELRFAVVDEAGLVAALNLGLSEAREPLVAFTDDDAVPSPDWLERIGATFDSDERIAAVGGRDILIVDGRVVPARRSRVPGRAGKPPEVGRVQWFGRMIANHHCGAGEPRDVDMLKGVNMSFRRSTVLGHGFDERLRGVGSVVHSELSICFPLRRRGFRVVYDPAILVHHYPAPRPHGDDRDRFDAQLVAARAHNETLALLDYLAPRRRRVFTVWGVVVGTTDVPGLVILARDMLTGRAPAWRRMVAAQRGRAAAFRTRHVQRPVPAALADIAGASGSSRARASARREAVIRPGA